jgi:hypothetical protein
VAGLAFGWVIAKTVALFKRFAPKAGNK